MNGGLEGEFRKTKTVFYENQRFCIISHRGPDGDAIGSNLALRLGLEALGKGIVSACVDEPPVNSMFLKKADTFVRDFNYEDFDVIVSVDCGDIKLVKFHEKKPEILSGEKPFVNFDHHESNNLFGTINPVEKNAAATCVVLYKFFNFCGWKITIDIANCLLHGIYFDTGGMIHSNATAEVFQIVGELVLKGANVKKISKELFHTTPVNKLRLWGKILERAYMNEEGVVVSAIAKSDYAECGATSHDTGGAIDYLNSVPESKYCVLLSEDEKGVVKGSLRTQRNDVNLSEIASKWGGGGHSKASGFGMEGTLHPIMNWKILKNNEGDCHGEEVVF